MTKLLTIISVAILLSGCEAMDIPTTSSGPTPAQAQSGYKNTFFLNLTKYSEKGFLITPEKYPGEYEAVGLIQVVVLPRAYKPEGPIPKVPDGYELYRGEWLVEKVDIYVSIDKMYEDAVDMGADAIMNFRFSSKKHYLGYNAPFITEYEVSGFAIKRK